MSAKRTAAEEALVARVMDAVAAAVKQVDASINATLAGLLRIAGYVAAQFVSEETFVDLARGAFRTAVKERRARKSDA